MRGFADLISSEFNCIAPCRWMFSGMLQVADADDKEAWHLALLCLLVQPIPAWEARGVSNVVLVCSSHWTFRLPTVVFQDEPR